MRIAHLSDLHFSKISFTMGQLFSKRWLGNLNLFVSRKKAFNTERLFPLVERLQQEKVDHLIVTGDLSTTSLEAEFAQALELIKAFQEVGIKTHILPGNHDHYTKKAYKNQLFYRYFPSELKEKGVYKTLLSPGWWLVSLDTALATSLFSSRGHFTLALEEALISLLNEIPTKDKIILANHFPLFGNDGPRKALLREKELRKVILKYPQIAFYLHGHTHRHSVADLRVNGLPIILESGSASHIENGSWNLLDISPKETRLQRFQFHEEKGWYASKQFSFF